MLESASRGGVSAPGGGVCSQGGLLGWGVSAPGGSVYGGVCSWGEGGGSTQGRSASGGGSALGGGIPACTEADPPCEQNDKQV